MVQTSPSWVNFETLIAAKMLRVGWPYLTFTGFEGDRVGDPTVHGGLSKAVYAYPAEHFTFWQTVRVQARAADGEDCVPHLRIVDRRGDEDGGGEGEEGNCDVPIVFVVDEELIFEYDPQ